MILKKGPLIKKQKKKSELETVQCEYASMTPQDF